MKFFNKQINIPTPEQIIENQKLIAIKQTRKDEKIAVRQLEKVRAILLKSSNFPVKYKSPLNSIAIAELKKAGWDVYEGYSYTFFHIQPRMNIQLINNVMTDNNQKPKFEEYFPPKNTNS